MFKLPAGCLSCPLSLNLPAGCVTSPAGCLMLPAGCLMLPAGCLMLPAGCLCVFAVLPARNFAQGPRCSFGMLCLMLPAWVFKFAPRWVFNVAGWVFMCCSITRPKPCPRTTLQSWCAVDPATMAAMDLCAHVTSNCL